MRLACHGISILHRSSSRTYRLAARTSPTQKRTLTKMSTTGSAAAPAPAPWYAAYPAPKSEIATIPREEVLAMLKATPVDKRDFVLVDLRRNDFEVSFEGEPQRVSRL